MAAPVYSNDLITIATGDLNFDAGTWDESSDGGWDTGGAMVDDENLWYTENSVNTGEAANSCTSAQYTKDGTTSGAGGPGTIMYVHTAAFTVPTDGVCLIHSLWAAPTSLNIYAGTANSAEAGVSVIIGDSFGVFDVFYVSGSDEAPAPEGGWATYAVDPTLTPDNSVGSPTTTTMVGTAIAAAQQARGNPHAVQAVRYGRAEVEYTVGDSTTPATFTGYAAIDNAAKDRFNLLQEIEGGYKARGLMSFGTAATAVYFEDSDKSIVIADDLKVSSTFNKGVVTNASSTLNWTNIAVTNLSAVAKYTFTVNDSATTNHSGCVFTDLGAFVYGSNSTQTNVTYRRQDLITQGSGTFTGCTFDSSNNTSGLLADDVDLVTDCTFISDATGHAVDLGTISTNTTVLWGNSLDDGAGTEWTGSAGGPTTGPSGTTNDALVCSVNTGITLTVSVQAGATIPTVQNLGVGDVTITAGEVTTKIIVKHSDGTLITTEDANVLVEATAGGSLAVGTDIIKGFTDVNGEIQDTRSFATNQPIAGRVRKGTSSPFYKTFNFTGTINTVSGFTQTATLIDDE